MKAFTMAVLVFTAAVFLSTQPAHAQDAGAKPVPVEAFYCNLLPGKEMKDLLAVAERFSQWADKNFADYSAWILTPNLGRFDELPDVLWLGSSASGNHMGRGNDAYMAGAGDIQKAFDAVVDCFAHGVASSTEINAPDGPPGNGVVMFSQCSIAEGSDWGKAVAAHKQYAGAMRGLGAKGSNWMFLPLLGGGDVEFDYWGVTTFANWTDFFAAYELYVNGGGWQKAQQAMAGATNCQAGTPSVWDVRLVRAGER